MSDFIPDLLFGLFGYSSLIIRMAIIVTVSAFALYIVGKKLLLLNYKLKKEERQAEQAERAKQAELVRKAEEKSE